MHNFDFRKTRVGYLYGSFQADNSVRVECIYEPPQENTDISFNVLEDPLEVTVIGIYFRCIS